MPVPVATFPVPLESDKTVSLVVARSRSLVFATGVIALLGRVKFAVYKAVPFTQWKFVIYPLKAAAAEVLDSFPILRTLEASLKFVEFAAVVPICVPSRKTLRDPLARVIAI